jgi:hypothetical protein
VRAEPATQAKGAGSARALGYAQPLWGKFWVGGQQCGEWADEEDKPGAEFPNAEGAWEIAACWLKSEFLDVEPITPLANDIIVADMVAMSVVAADLVTTETFAKGAIEDMGALGACTGTLWAKGGHLFVNDRTASRFSRLFADFVDYDDFATPGGAQLDKLGPWPYSTTSVLDTG